MFTRMHPQIAFLLVFGSVTAFLISGLSGQEKALPSQIHDFLKLTAHIILPQERNVLLKLERTSDQELFIKSFWRRRDPTPGTTQNEFKEDLLKRFLYVNKYFSRGTTREGWQTDRGRVYMILGEPASRRDFSGKRGIYPCEVWYYYGDKDKDLPAHFGLIFFKRKGTGELRLYDPVSDGITSLLMNAESSTFDDYPALFRQLRDLVPELAPIALSIIPGEIPFNYTPSPRETILISNILESPKKGVDPSYATHFLDYVGMVSTEYMSNYIENTACVDVYHDPFARLKFVGFSIAPKSISLGYYEPSNQYYCNLLLSVGLHKGESIIFQYTKEFPLYFSPDEAERVMSNGISLEDSFPVIEGRYQVLVLLQNSMGKEFSIHKEDVVIPATGRQPQLIGPVLGYALKEYGRNVFLPYKLGDKKLLIDPARTFSPQEGLSFFISLSEIDQAFWNVGRINISIKGSDRGPLGAKTLALPLNSEPYADVMVYHQSISAMALPPDYYTLEATLQDSIGRAVDVSTSRFIISSSTETPHPLAQMKMLQMNNLAPFYLMLASQYEMTEMWQKAEEYYERASSSNPEGRRSLIEYARFLLKAGKPEKSLALIEGIRDEATLRFDYCLVKGLAAMALDRTEEAVASFLEANEIYDSDILLLNSLGLCYSKLGEQDKALEVFRASVRLNPNQDAIVRLISELEKRRKHMFSPGPVSPSSRS